MNYKMLYPETRAVTGEWIMCRAAEAASDGSIRRAVDVEDAIWLLEDLGKLVIDGSVEERGDV